MLYAQNGPMDAKLRCDEHSQILRVSGKSQPRHIPDLDPARVYCSSGAVAEVRRRAWGSPESLEAAGGGEDGRGDGGDGGGRQWRRGRSGRRRTSGRRRLPAKFRRHLGLRAKVNPRSGG